MLISEDNKNKLIEKVVFVYSFSFFKQLQFVALRAV